MATWNASEIRFSERRGAGINHVITRLRFSENHGLIRIISSLYIPLTYSYSYSSLIHIPFCRKIVTSDGPDFSSYQSIRKTITT
ncbi:hypothetical protein Mhar_2409 (plasmid) [Methanothrix harundinacea 6Ac]|uniref:Uncharacterized protein n=1 Tax=Methanothrix harundinacea (strain 6Ac) TaxID=1110509 RepID=G7WRL8_METH6|nr:hypothetical protein Mhar_2409 [Methanothrix harundinacea 6Ac]